ncbi:MAG: hypothetical protein FH758_06070 [Firmicutes bacterium]|nr:hypothetical protein [Bacillota bacterium]
MDNEMQEIDLRQLLYILWKRKWIIVYITMACLITAGVVSFFILQPSYEANAKVIIVKDKAMYFLEDRYTNSDVNLYMNVAKTYEEIAKSRTVRHRVQEKVGGGFNEIKNIKVESKPDTQVLTITVSHPSAEDVAVYANVLAQEFITVSGEVLPAGELRILDKAERPRAPASPNYMLNIAISFVLGVMISVGTIFLLECFNQFIETEQDVEDCLNLPVLCVVSRSSTNEFNIGEKLCCVESQI